MPVILPIASLIKCVNLTALPSFLSVTLIRITCPILFVLEKLQLLGLLSYTTARSSTHQVDRDVIDDAEILEFANRNAGSLVSSNRFVNFLQKNGCQRVHELIRNRRLDIQFRSFGEKSTFRWRNKDRFYGGFPSIFYSGFVNNGGESDPRLVPRLFAFPWDLEYSQAMDRRKSNWSDERNKELIQAVDSLMDIVDREMQSEAEYCLASKRSKLRPRNRKPYHPCNWSAPSFMREGLSTSHGSGWYATSYPMSTSPMFYVTFIDTSKPPPVIRIPNMASFIVEGQCVPLSCIQQNDQCKISEFFRSYRGFINFLIEERWTQRCSGEFTSEGSEGSEDEEQSSYVHHVRGQPKNFYKQSKLTDRKVAESASYEVTV